MPRLVPLGTAGGQHGLPAGAAEDAATRTDGDTAERPEGTLALWPALRAVSLPSPTAALRGELAWLEAAYHRALRGAARARDAEAIRSAFDEADRLQRRILAASHRLRAEAEAEGTAATVRELSHQHATAAGPPPRSDDAA